MSSSQRGTDSTIRITTVSLAPVHCNLAAVRQSQAVFARLLLMPLDVTSQVNHHSARSRRGQKGRSGIVPSSIDRWETNDAQHVMDGSRRRARRAPRVKYSGTEPGIGEGAD